jgi:hypothetical protein
MSVVWCSLQGMEQLFDITVDEATMLALGIPVLDGDFPVDRDAAYPPVDPQADVWELAWHAVQAAELAAPSPQRSIRTRIDNLVALRQRMSALQVEEMRELAAIAKLNREQAEQRHPDDDPDWANSLETAQRSLAAELALANKVSARTMENRIGEAEQLVDLFPETLETLATGEIGLGHARVIMEHGAQLDDDKRAKFEHIVLEQAIEVTPGRLTRTAESVANRLTGAHSIRSGVTWRLNCSSPASPATLNGGSPIGLDDARALAADAPSLVRILTDPITDQVLAVDTYRPLCRGDHILKHHGGWSVRQISPGVLEWISPHGIVAIDKPDPPLAFGG